MNFPGACQTSSKNKADTWDCIPHHGIFYPKIIALCAQEYVRKLQALQAPQVTHSCDRVGHALQLGSTIAPAMQIQ